MDDAFSVNTETDSENQTSFFLFSHDSFDFDPMFTIFDFKVIKDCMV